MSRKETTKVTRTQRYVIDGKEYRSLEEIPAAEREKLKFLQEKMADLFPAGVLQPPQEPSSPEQPAPIAPGADDRRRARLWMTGVILSLLATIAYLLLAR